MIVCMSMIVSMWTNSSGTSCIHIIHADEEVVLMPGIGLGPRIQVTAIVSGSPTISMFCPLA